MTPDTKEKTAANKALPNVPVILSFFLKERYLNYFHFTVITNTKTTCKIGTRNAGYDNLEWTIKQDDDKHYLGTISCDQITAASKLDSCDRNFGLYAICRNSEGDSQAQYASYSYVAPNDKSSCNNGSAKCGNSCYNSAAQKCDNGTISCVITGGDYGDSFDESKNYYPAYVCNPDHTVVGKRGPVTESGSRSGACDYIPNKICDTDEKCVKGQCARDENAPSKQLFVSHYGSDTGGSVENVSKNSNTGQLIDRITGQPIQPQYKTFDLYNKVQVRIAGDAQGLDTLNAALALIGANSIKSRQWFIQTSAGDTPDDQNAPIVEGPGTFICLNFAADTQKMLRDNGIKNAYTVEMSGVGADGGTGTAHAIIAIKVGENQSGPVFVGIEAESGQVMGQIGFDDANAVTPTTPITDSYNNPQLGWGSRFDNVAVVDNYDIALDGGLIANDKSNIYTYTPVPEKIDDTGQLNNDIAIKIKGSAASQ